MIKKKILYTLFIFITFSSCADYLEVTPDNRIEANTLEKVSEILVSAYPRGAYFFTDWMTDDVEYIEENLQRPSMTDIFLWEDADEHDDYNTVTNYWQEAYAAIAQANAALEALENITDDRTKFRSAIKGEALACRAYAHFMLVSLFAKNYDAGTAASDLGVPYVTDSEKVLLKDYKRNTVKEVFDNIEKDFTEALTLIDDEFYYGTKKFHFTEEAANALACRFYLFKKDYAKSIEYGNKILGAGLAFEKSYIKDMFTYGGLAGNVAQRNFFVAPTDRSNILIVEKQIGVGLRHYYGYRTSADTWNNAFPIPNLWTEEGSNNDDSRRISYGREINVTAKLKEEFYKESLTATTGFPFCVQPVIRGEEILFNRIECMIELGNYQDALTVLNEFAKLRYENPITIDLATLKEKLGDLSLDDKNALLTLLLKEKRKEFFQEGMRWFDIKRHQLAVVHKTAEKKDIVLKADDLRKVLQIPSIATARGLAKNPR